MAEVSFSDVEIAVVLFRLTRYAQGLFGASRSLGVVTRDVAFAGGDGPEDLAMNLLLRFIDPQDTTVQWRGTKGQPTTDAVYALLRRALFRDFCDLKKSKRYRTSMYVSTVRADGDSGLSLEELAVYLETPEGVVLREQARQRLLDEFSGDSLAQEILKLQLDPAGYNGFSNQELAELLDTTVPDIENRKKRVRVRLLSIHARQAEGESNV